VLKRWIKTLLKALLALLVLLFLFLLFERVRGQVSLARFKRELIARGEKLTFRELIPPVPEGENGAPEILEAVKRLQNGAVLPDNYPPIMRVMPSGRAIVSFRESEWIDGKKTNHWDQLSADLKTNEAALDQIRLALEKQVFNNNLDYSQGFRMRCDHLAPPKRLAFWLGAASQRALHEGKPHEALESLVAQIRLPRLLREDRVLISELVRIAIAAIARVATWEALQADGLTDEDLAHIQQAWQTEDFMTAMARSLEGERVYCETAFEQLRHSNKDAVELLSWQEEFPFPFEGEIHRPWWRGEVRRELYCRVWRFAWSYQDERLYLEHMQRLLEVIREAMIKKSLADVQPIVAQLDEESSNKNLYDQLRYSSALSVSTISYGVKKAMRAETERSATICAIALKRYSIRHGKSSASLDALVPEFLSSVPIDYMDGKPMKYHLNADGTFTLYSVGEDGKDDGGDASLLPDKKSFRNLWDKRDFIWPTPALPEEVEAYRKEARKN
jgi:hypothetical protein